jgi:hypothetical protein
VIGPAQDRLRAREGKAQGAGARPRRASGRGGAALLLGLAVALGGCAESASTANLKGEAKAVAQVISNFRSSASTGDEKAICAHDLAATLKTKLSKQGVGCVKAIEEQLHQVDTFTLDTLTVAITGAHARAKIQSTFSGKLENSMLLLLREGKSWKIAEAPVRAGGG